MRAAGVMGCSQLGVPTLTAFLLPRPLPRFSDIVPVPSTALVLLAEFVIISIRILNSSAPAAASAEPTDGIAESTPAGQEPCHAAARDQRGAVEGDGESPVKWEEPS